MAISMKFALAYANLFLRGLEERLFGGFGQFRVRVGNLAR